MKWVVDMPATDWDRALAGLGGHPLQSALWGDSRSAVDGIRDRRWAMLGDGGRAVFMARVEARPIRGIGKAAWIPRGPATAEGARVDVLHREFLDILKSEKYLLCVDDSYPERALGMAEGVLLPPRPRTIWIDLTTGKDGVMEKLDAQWRAGVRVAARAGVVVEPTTNPAYVAAFYAMCEATSRAKNFVLSGSLRLMQALCASEPGADAEAALMLARFETRVAAGVLAMRCGRSIHYMWGASDRAFAKQRVGEAVQWAVIEWALQKGCATYDLEGIDAESNSGVTVFKRKMGGMEVELPGRRAHTLGVTGAVLLRAARWLGKL